LTGLAGAEDAISDPSERALDRSEEAQVGLMQVDLKFRFGIRVRLIDLIAFPASRGRDGTLGFGSCD
jgi:hypothetical protein